MSQTEFVRRPDYVSGGITKEEEAKMKEHVDLWIRRIMRTEPIERDKIIPAIKNLYKCAGLKAPRVVIVQSPLVMAFAGGAASWILYCQKHANNLQATDQATRQATDREIRLATFQDTNKSIYQATRRATSQATDQTTDQTTNEAIHQATMEATERETWLATLQTTDQAIHQATIQATERETWLATRQATDQAIYQTTDLETDQVTLWLSKDVWSVTQKTTMHAIWHAVWQAIDGNTQHAIWLATMQSIVETTHHATCRATREGIDKTIDKTMLRENWLAGQNGIKCAKKWYEVVQGGNMSAQYDCYLTACRDIFGLKLPDDNYSAWEQAAIHGGYRWMHEEFCIVCDFPEILKKDDQHRPHCDDGPSHRWRDGWSLYYIHGIQVTEQIVMHPETITVDQIDQEENAEVRRIMIDRYGLERYVGDSGSITVCRYPDDYPIKGLRTARLIKKNLDNDEPIVLLDMLNSTPEPDGSTKRYMIRIDPHAYNGLASNDCLAAMASTYRMFDGSLVFKSPEDYLPEVES